MKQYVFNLLKTWVVDLVIGYKFKICYLGTGKHMKRLKVKNDNIFILKYLKYIVCSSNVGFITYSVYVNNSYGEKK